MKNWKEILCNECQHLVSKHRERKESYDSYKSCDGGGSIYKNGQYEYHEECPCELKKAEVIYNSFETRISDLENRISS